MNVKEASCKSKNNIVVKLKVRLLNFNVPRFILVPLVHGSLVNNTELRRYVPGIRLIIRNDP